MNRMPLFVAVERADTTYAALWDEEWHERWRHGNLNGACGEHAKAMKVVRAELKKVRAFEPGARSLEGP